MTASEAQKTRRHLIEGLIFWILVPLGVGWIASFAPTGSEWYESLNKAPFSPPDITFAIVWPILYVLMGVATWRVWRNGGFAANRRLLSFFLGHLVLNAAWPYVFFGQQQIVLGAILLVVILIAVLGLLTLYQRKDRWAGLLLLPYVAWLFFATTLNIWIWVSNP